ncbi:hypothetical protein V8C35DRAFT_297011 [Trichoderma chlorosporum]
MALSIRDLVRILRVGNSFVSGVREAGFYIAAEDNNELSELRWVGPQLASETLIGSGVRSQTPTVYTTHDNKRSVFCVGENNALRLFRLDDEWREIKLNGNGEISVHPLSRLSGSIHGNDSLVFFEDTAGHLRGARIQENGNWELFPFAPVRSTVGCSHFAQVRDNEVYLSYIHTDGFIHQQTIHLLNNKDNDVVVQGAQFINGSCVNFIIGVLKEKDFLVIALTTVNKEQLVVSVDSEGELSELGKIDEKGVFIPSTSEENTSLIVKTGNAAANNAIGGKKKK